jgi:hypothetical protein
MNRGFKWVTNPRRKTMMYEKEREFLQAIVNKKIKPKIKMVICENWTNPLDRKHKEKYFVSLKLVHKDQEFCIPDFPGVDADEFKREFPEFGGQFVYSGGNLSKIKSEIREDWGHPVIK